MKRADRMFDESAPEGEGVCRSAYSLLGAEKP